MVDAFREKLIDDAAIHCTDVERKGSDEENFIFFHQAGSAGLPDLLKLKEQTGLDMRRMECFGKEWKKSRCAFIVKDSAIEQA